MKATIHYHQVICSESGKPCGDNNTYCEKCLFKNNLEYTTITTDGWQLCPKCNGDGHLGRYNSPNLSDTTAPKCDVCSGKKIISTGTGLPAPDSESVLSKEETDILNKIYQELWMEANYDRTTDEIQKFAKPLSDMMSKLNKTLQFKK